MCRRNCVCLSTQQHSFRSLQGQINKQIAISWCTYYIYYMSFWIYRKFYHMWSPCYSLFSKDEAQSCSWFSSWVCPRFAAAPAALHLFDYSPAAARCSRVYKAVTSATTFKFVNLCCCPDKGMIGNSNFKAIRKRNNGSMKISSMETQDYNLKLTDQYVYITIHKQLGNIQYFLHKHHMLGC